MLEAGRQLIDFPSHRNNALLVSSTSMYTMLLTDCWLATPSSLLHVCSGLLLLCSGRTQCCANHSTETQAGGCLVGFWWEWPLNWHFLRLTALRCSGLSIRALRIMWFLFRMLTSCCQICVRFEVIDEVVFHEAVKVGDLVHFEVCKSLYLTPCKISLWKQL